MKQYMNIVIVGHVDHGKSTLIGRLFYDTDSLPDEKLKELKQVSEALGKELEFGFVLDHLEEERKQGITIDTTQQFFNTKKRDYTIIDAPGHVEFVKNMITGATQADAAILIVDASEGVQEQTKRHSYILSMLGLKQVIAVINKMDLIDYNEEKFKKIKNNLLEFLDKLEIKPKFVIPISAKKGDNIANKSDNMEWYNGKTVLESLDSFDIEEINEEKLRFAVQDVYNFDERIIAGKVISGELRKNMEVNIIPSNEKAKIDKIKIFGGELEKAETGKNIGLVLDKKRFVERGQIFTEDETKTKNQFKAKIFCLSPESIKKGDTFVLRCSTQETDCEIKEIIEVIDSSSLEKVENEEIKNRQAANVLIEASKPVLVENFNEIPELGRFVLEKQETVAGGIIT